MPAAVPVLVSAALGGISGGLAASAAGISWTSTMWIGAVVANAALGAGVGALQAIAGKPKSPKSNRSVSDRLSTTAQRNLPVPVVYGRGRVPGNLIQAAMGRGMVWWFGTKLEDNGGRVYVIHSVIALCEGEIQAAGNYVVDGKPIEDYYQDLRDRLISPDVRGFSLEERKKATFYFDLNRGTADQSIHPMVLDADPNLSPADPPPPAGFTIENEDGVRTLTGTGGLPIPYRNTATVATQLFTGHSVHLPQITADVVGQDFTLVTGGSNLGTNSGDVVGNVIGYDAYSETFFWTLSSSSGTTHPFGLIRIHRTGLHGRQHTFPPDSVSDDVEMAWFIGKHDIVIMQDPDDGSLFHLGCWGIDRDSDLWESHRPTAGTGIYGGYENEILSWHLDELHATLHTLHQDSDSDGVIYIMRWNPLTGRTDRIDTNLEWPGSGSFGQMIYSPDLHAYIVVADDQLIALSPDTGNEFARTDDIDLSNCKGIFVSGVRVGVVTTTGVTFWDATEPNRTYGPYGGSGTDLSEGAFGGTVHAVQNTWTGQVTIVKPNEGTVAFINFIPSVLEEISDVSAMGTPGQAEFQSFWGSYAQQVVGDTFSWATGPLEEPYFKKVSPSTEAYVRASTVATFDITDAHDKLVFGNESFLDDILILVKPGDSVPDDWNGIAERPTVTFTIPDDAIIIANTHGSYMSEEDDTYYATCPKVFEDSTHTLSLPDGDLDDVTDDTYAAFVSAGFDVCLFGDGVPRSMLEDKGFITDGVLECKLVHIVCGRGEAGVKNMGLLANSIPNFDPDEVGGWVRDWSYRTYNVWSLRQLEGNSSLAGALYATLVDVPSLDSKRWGAGLDPDKFCLPSFEALHSRCVAGWKYANAQRPNVTEGTSEITFTQTYRFAERYKFDFVLDVQTGLADFCTSQILGACNGYWYTGWDSKLHVGIPLPGALPVLHLSDEKITDTTPKVQFSGSGAQVNRVWVQYREIRDNHRIDFGKADDQFAQGQYGRVAYKSIDLGGIGRKGQADLIARQILDELSARRRNATFEAGFMAYALSPGDVVETSYANTSLSRTPLRIVDIAEGSKNDFKLTGSEWKPILPSLADVAPGGPAVGSVGSEIDEEQEAGDCEEQTGSAGSGVRWFNGGSNYAAGCYDLFYVTNCYRLYLTPLGGFAVEGYDVVTRDDDGDIVVLIAAPAVANPPEGWTHELEAVTANTGQSATFTLSEAGPVGLRLRTPPAVENFGEFGPCPTYRLCICGEEPETGEASVSETSEPPETSEPIADFWIIPKVCGYLTDSPIYAVKNPTGVEVVKFESDACYIIDPGYTHYDALPAGYTDMTESYTEVVGDCDDCTLPFCPIAYIVEYSPSDCGCKGGQRYGGPVGNILIPAAGSCPGGCRYAGQVSYRDSWHTISCGAPLDAHTPQSMGICVQGTDGSGTVTGSLSGEFSCSGTLPADGNKNIFTVSNTTGNCSSPATYAHQAAVTFKAVW